MLEMLKTGDQLRTVDGKCFDVINFLGAGGQGEVYRIRLDDTEFALKCYLPSMANSEQADALLELVKRGPPNEQFLWPLAFVPATSSAGYGYLMALREDRFAGLEDLVLGNVHTPPSFEVLCKSAINLVLAFRTLHISGLCYKDINFGNVFLDTSTGDIAICDNDNVRVNRQHSTQISGTAPFMAPEIWRDEADPSTDTDLHSLGVLLFYIFVRAHPLEGALEANINIFNEAAKKQLYGNKPLFIFDPNDTSNRPVEGIHGRAATNWERYPRFFKEQFELAFTEGLLNPQRRTTTTEWIDVLSRLRDSIVTCGSCGKETFYDKERIFSAGKLKCSFCSRTTNLPSRLKLDQHVVMLRPHTALFPHHLGTSLEFGQPIAQVTQHPSDPNRWGITNLGTSPWSFETSDGSIRELPAGKTVLLRNNLKINFGAVEGIVRVI